PVEVPFAEAISLGFRQRRPATMLVTRRRNRDGDGATGNAFLPFVAEDQAPPDVEVAVEPEPFVDRTARRGVATPEREHVALDRGDVARRCLLELAEVVADDPEPAGHAHARIVE